MFSIEPLTPAIGAELCNLDLSQDLSAKVFDAIYQALLDHQVIFIRDANISPSAHLAFAQSFGELDAPHPIYPHVEGYKNIVLLENNADTPPDTDSWHTDLTFAAEQPFASILVARQVPAVGGDTLWSSCYAAYDRLSDGMKTDLENLNAIHDFGDFRNSFATDRQGDITVDRLNAGMDRFGQNNHMNQPEDQVRWRWTDGSLAMWDNRVTMHYAVADYLPEPRSMNRITVVNDRRDKASSDMAAAGSQL